MSDRRRVWITGIGIACAIGTGLDAFRAGLRAGRSPVKRIDRFDPSPFRSQVAAQVDDFDPLAWMPPKTARQLDRFSQFGLVTGRLAFEDAGLSPGRGRGRCAGADRDLPRLRAGRDRLRGGTARALPRAGHPKRRPEPGPGRLRWRGARQPGHRPRRPRADPLDRQLLRVGGRRPRRGPRRPARGPDRCRHRRRLRDPPEPTRLRGVRHHPRAVGRPQRRPGSCRAAVRYRARRVRDGRRRGAPRPGGGRGRGAPWRDAVRRAAGLRRHIRCAPHGPAAERRQRGRTCSLDRPRRRWRRSVGDRLRQRPRLVDADRRRGRGAGPRDGSGRAGRDGPGQRHEGALRAPARSVGGHRGRDLRPGHPRRMGAGLGQSRRSRSRGAGAPAGTDARGA